MRKQETTAPSITIDQEFARICNCLTGEELKLLSASIHEHGCRDPLVLWRGVLLDGHHRLRICRESFIPFTVVTIDLPDRDAAIQWIVRNQLGRRNLTAFARIQLVAHLEEPLRRKASARQGHRTDIYPEEGPSIDVRSEMAKVANVGRHTWTYGSRLLKVADDETKRKLQFGELTINRAYSERFPPPNAASESAKEPSQVEHSDLAAAVVANHAVQGCKCADCQSLLGLAGALGGKVAP